MSMDKISKDMSCVRADRDYEKKQKLPASEAMAFGLYLPQRTVYLGNVTYTDQGEEVGIDSAVAERVIGGLIYLNGRSSDRINLVMNTVGGQVASGFAIYDAIRSSRSPVDIEVLGEASSMGAIILQAGRMRSIYPNASILIHEGKIGNIDASMRQHEAWAEWAKKDRIKMYKLLGENTKWKAKKWEEICAKKQDAIFDAERALDVGLVDRIVGPAEWAIRARENKK